MSYSFNRFNVNCFSRCYTRFVAGNSPACCCCVELDIEITLIELWKRQERHLKLLQKVQCIDFITIYDSWNNLI